MGDRIAALRMRFGWSQSELAWRLNISPSAVGMYEQGRREPSVDMLVKLSRILGVSIDFLVLGRPVYQRDWKAQAAISDCKEVPSGKMEPLQHFSRDELMVLLAAVVCSSEE